MDETLSDAVTAFLSIIQTLDALADASDDPSLARRVSEASDELATSNFLASITSARLALIGRG